MSYETRRLRYTFQRPLEQRRLVETWDLKGEGSSTAAHGPRVVGHGRKCGILGGYLKQARGHPLASMTGMASGRIRIESRKRPTHLLTILKGASLDSVAPVRCLAPLLPNIYERMPCRAPQTERVPTGVLVASFTC
jgi:hypothetical protein